MYIRIPHFDTKLRYLFSQHPKIHNYASLAATLGFSPSLIAGWKNGTQTTAPQQIPIMHVQRVCDLLGVDQDTLQLGDLAEFTRRRRGDPSLWGAAVMAAPTSDKLQILPAPASLEGRRGLIDPTAVDPDIRVFNVGDQVVVKLDAETGKHALLLQEDRSGWQCLHPTKTRLETRLEGPLFFPPQANPAQPVYARFDTVTGPLKLVAVVTETPLPETSIRALINNDDLPAALGHLAALLSQGGAEIVQAQCYVS